MPPKAQKVDHNVRPLIHSGSNLSNKQPSSRSRLNIETVQSECVIETDYDKEMTPIGKPKRRASINQTPTSRFSMDGPGKIFERTSTPQKSGSVKFSQGVL